MLPVDDNARYSVHADVSNRDRGILNFGLNLQASTSKSCWLILFQHRVRCKYQYPKKCCSSEPSSKIITEDFLGFYNHYKMCARVCVCVCVCVCVRVCANKSHKTCPPLFYHCGLYSNWSIFDTMYFQSQLLSLVCGCLAFNLFFCSYPAF